MQEPAAQKFFYWVWSPFHVLVFVLLSVLYIAPAFVLVAVVADAIENVFAPGPYKPGVDWLGAGPIAILSAPIAVLMAQATMWGSHYISLHIQGEKEYGPRITAAIAGVLTVLVWTGKIHLDPHAHYSIFLSAGVFAGVIILLLNLVAWILRLITGREIIFAHLQRQQAEEQKAQDEGRKVRAKKRKTRAKAEE